MSYHLSIHVILEDNQNLINNCFKKTLAQISHMAKKLIRRYRFSYATYNDDFFTSNFGMIEN